MQSYPQEIFDFMSNVLKKMDTDCSGSPMPVQLCGDLQLSGVDFDLTQIEADLAQIITKLNEDCVSGNPIRVQVCNPTDLTFVENSLTDILAVVSGIEEDTTGIQDDLDAVISGIQTGNTSLMSIDSGIQLAISGLQNIDANTDNLESQLTTLQTLNQNEFDQTQALLQVEFDQQQIQFADMVTLLSGIDQNTAQATDLSGLEECCASGNALTTQTNIELSGVNSKLDEQTTILAEISGQATDLTTLENLTASGNASVVNQEAQLSGVLSLLSDISGKDNTTDLSMLEALTVSGNSTRDFMSIDVSGIRQTQLQLSGLTASGNIELSGINLELDRQTQLLQDISGKDNTTDLSTLEALTTSGNNTLNFISADTSGIGLSVANQEIQLSGVLDTLSSISGLESTQVSLLQDISGQAIDLTNLETLTTSGNVDLAAINTAVANQEVQLSGVLTTLSAIQAKLNEDCSGSPIKVEVCNPTDLSTVESSLNNILTQVSGVNANTDTVEANLIQLISGVQTGNTTLATIDTVLDSSLIELQAINANTDTAETLITNLQTTVQTESDQTQVLLTSISGLEATQVSLLQDISGQSLDLNTLETLTSSGNTTRDSMAADISGILSRLSQSCSGNPIAVTVCNQIDLSTVETSLSNILTQVSGVNANTDTVEASLTQLIADVQSGNTTLAAIDTVLDNSLVELQAINANTDTVETLITNLQSTVQSEFDQTQVLLTAISGFEQTQITLLQDISGQSLNLGTLESLTSSGNSLLTDLSGCCSTQTSLLQDISGQRISLTQLETLTNSGNTILQTEFDAQQVQFGTMISSLSGIQSKLNEPCGGSPLNVTVCNSGVDPVDARPELSGIITELQDVNSELDAQTVLGTTTNTLLTDVSGLVSSTNSILSGEINVNLDRGDSCGSPLFISPCNSGVQSDTLTAVQNQEVQLSGVISVLQDISGQSLDLSTLEECCASGNVDLAAQTVLDNIRNTVLNAIQVNTSGTNSELDAQTPILSGIQSLLTDISGKPETDLSTLEQLTSSGNNILQVELDQSQVLLADVSGLLSAVNTKLNEACGGTPQNVFVCPGTAANVTTTSEVRTATNNIPAGFRHGSIAIISGTWTINGATYNSSESLSLPPMSYGSTDLRYDQYDIVLTSGSGSVRVHFVT